MKGLITGLLKSRNLIGVIACCVFGATVQAAAPLDVEVFHDKKGEPYVIWNVLVPGSLNPDEHIWVEYAPNTVWKTMPDGSVWLHDCDNQAIITIGTGDGTDAKPTNVMLEGTGTMILTGDWVPEEGGLSPGNQVKFQIVARLIAPATGEVWKLVYVGSITNGIWSEKFRLEPLK